MDVQKALEEIHILIQDVTDPVAKVIISRLLNIIEALMQENKALKEEIQRLRDENNRLKEGWPSLLKFWTFGYRVPRHDGRKICLEN